MPRYDKPEDFAAIRGFAAGKKQAAAEKAKYIYDELISQGYSKDGAKAKTDAWLKSIIQSWDDFVRDQTAILNARLARS